MKRKETISENLRAVLLSCAIIVGMGEVANATDLLPPAPPIDSPGWDSDLDSIGVGWYLRGAATWSRDNVPPLSADGTLGNLRSLKNIAAFSIGFGYQINNWFRTDVTGEWRSRVSSNRVAAATFSCPIEIRGLTDPATSTNIGIYAIQNQCRSTESAVLNRGVFLVNGYFDLGTWADVTPFVGAGVGLAYGRVTGNYNWIDTANNGPYNGNLVAPGGFPIIWMDAFGNPAPAHQFGVQSRARSLSQTKFNFAWALMSGFAYKISPNAEIEFSYRYLNMGKWSTSGKANTAQDVRIGFRYGID